MSNPRFAVIICAYTDDRWDDLLAAVESLRRQTVTPMEIVVVIDHNPGLLDNVLAHLPGVTALGNRHARGLSGARNTGIVAATEPLIAFLDDDAVAEPAWLEELAVGFADPAVIGVGGAIKPRWAGGCPAWFPEEFNWVVGCSYRGLPDRPTPVRNVIGANMAFRREAFVAVGDFRGGMGRIGTRPVGCEETEFCIRLRQRWPDRILLYRPQAVVHHRVPASRARWGYYAARCYAEGLSKALVADLVGAKDGLASERGYTLRTLPRGCMRGAGDALLGDRSGLARSGAIMAGLAMTAAGYLRGALALQLAEVRRETRLAD